MQNGKAKSLEGPSHIYKNSAAKTATRPNVALARTMVPEPVVTWVAAAAAPVPDDDGSAEAVPDEAVPDEAVPDAPVEPVPALPEFEVLVEVEFVPEVPPETWPGKVLVDDCAARALYAAKVLFPVVALMKN